MKMWIVAWPNGDKTVVIAENEDDAIAVLDEDGSADKKWLVEISPIYGKGVAFDVIVFGGEEDDYKIHPYQSLTEALEKLKETVDVEEN